jgi:exopolyphosphatase/guanosine-5'-triphosphate,3'-diphosphate pyrophosphatase
MARYATIDVGSNSVLLLVAEKTSDGFVTVEDRAELTRLGDGLQQTGKLSDLAMERTVQAIIELVRTAVEEHDVLGIAAVGTEALRAAVNGQELVRRAAEEATITIHVVGGEEEARLSFLAVRSGLGVGDAPVAIFDVGGGSTELILGRYGGMERRRSLRLGGLALTERFLRSDPVAPGELDRLRAHVDEVLAAVDPGPAPQQAEQAAAAEVEGGGAGPGVPSWRRPSTEMARKVVGIGGAVTTLAAVSMALEPYDPNRVHGSSLSLEEVRRQVQLYLGQTVEERRALPGLHPRRADTILCGAVITEAMMARLGVEALIVSDHGIRHGLMEDRFGL